MADSMPICDVLSEAMEYLAKLGTNIRIRSENLKEKRIRKEKLRDTNAIQKAVQKVLLICELSKKSIENVETGVKNLLLQVDKPGSSNQTCPQTREISDSVVEYEHFTYQSHRLKIRDKISVEHYTSVKVVSASIAKSILEKYPVYYDCKLYRARNKMKKRDVIGNVTCANLVGEGSNELGISLENSNSNTKDKEPDESEPNKNIHTDICESDLNNHNISDSQKPECDRNVRQHSVEKEPQNEISDGNSDLKEKQLVKTDLDKSYCGYKFKRKKKNKNPMRVMDDSSSSDNDTVTESKISKNISHGELQTKQNMDMSEVSSKSDEITGDKGIDIDGQEQHINVVDKEQSNMNQSNVSEKNQQKTDAEVHNDSTMEKKSKQKLFKQVNNHNSDSDREIIKSNDINLKNDVDTSIESSKKDDLVNIQIDDEKIKPLIKCVSLSKLLKPDRVKHLSVADELNENNEKSKHCESKKGMKSENNKKTAGKRFRRLQTFDDDDDNEEDIVYWTRKRKEVKKFKAKKFDINITRLPSISPSLLEKFNLKRIVHRGTLLCETGGDNSCDEENNGAESKAKKMKNFNLNKVKNALLNDSDSDDSETIKTNRKITKAIDNLYASEQENSEKIEAKLSENISPKSANLSVNDECHKIMSDYEKKNHETENSVSNDVVSINEKKSLQTSNQDKTKGSPLTTSDDKIESSEKDVVSHRLHEDKQLAECKLQNVTGDNEKIHKRKESSLNKSKSVALNDTVEVEQIDSDLNHEEGSSRSESMQKQQNLEKDSLKDTLEMQSEKEDINTAANCSPLKLPCETNNTEEEIQNKNIKNSLLEESDSEIQDSKQENQSSSSNAHNEKTIADKKDDTEKLKNFLLNNSDSESLKESDLKNKKENSRERDSPEMYISKDNFPHHEKEQSHNEKDTEIIKSSLLKDSSDDHSKTPKKRKRNRDDSPPPTSKRKHIMESMYAKKMLLTYSSSSDTEDEQLRNTLSEIKNDLLNGISSDEEGGDKSKIDTSELDDDNKKSEATESEDDLVKSKNLSGKEGRKLKINTEELSDNNSKDSLNSEVAWGSNGDNSSSNKMGPSSTTPDDNCSQNSDLPDAHDKEIYGLTNLKSLKKKHRRRESSTDLNRNTRSGRAKSMAKAGGLISNEGFLQAESSSDAASLSGSDQADADQEEMPQVKLDDINGVGHLAKDDLLGESDTSVSHDEKSGSKKGDDTDEDNVKSKRRRAVPISSDSEAGSSRRKDRNVRQSDFEDSEDDNSEPAKSKRKKKAIDSDASGNSSVDGGKKKRRRIKNVDDSEGSGSDTETEGRNKHGRKNIRKVMGKNQLEEATKRAAREEKERIARITERQKLYNNLEFDESGKPDEVVLEKVILDFDPETKEPLIEVDRGLVKKLKPHQANGIKFMWNACFESVKRIKKDKGSGCILAHCMGLGKTLQVVSLTHTLLTHSSLTSVNRVLVVCPLSTVLNWVNEFRMWLKHAETDYEVDIYELSKFKQNSERAFQLSQWFQHGGVCVLGYEMFRNLSADNVKKFKKKMLKNFQESLVDPGPDLVVCDEGHLLKNEKTSLSQSMNRVKTLRRIVLTGTPLQNNLKEYYCMVQFVKPNLLGKYNEYLNRFVNPITNGQYTDSTEHDIRVMKRRSHVLHKMLDGAVQRRDYGVLAPFLPPKHEYVLFITLTEVQVKLYQHYLDNYSRRPLPGKSSGFLFPDFQSLQRIWTHPLVLKYNSERYEIMQQKKREREEEDSEGSLVDFIDDDSTTDESTAEETSDDSSVMSDDSRKKSKKKKSAKKSKVKESKVTARRGTRANPIEIEDDEPLPPLEEKNENPTEWWMKLMGEDELEDLRNSSKLVLLFDILRQCEAIGDKLLVFSQSLYSLDLIEHFLGKVDEATQEGRVDEKLAGHVGSWSPGVDYFRLDGSTSCENRSIWCKNFNRVDNPRARLFLISTRAGGLGINLVAANRVVIFDVSWNPSHDVQSIFRVYRFGQKKPCYVYRFLAMGTMEEKIYERQVTKQAISKRVIDEQQIDRHYAENDLAELYKFEPRPPQPRPLPPLPKDRLFAEMLREHEAQIYKYHEHDSLLENKEEETLSEEERRAAWEDFENEKTRPPPPPLLAPYGMHNGMMPGLLAQQQQLAYAALASMLRKDMPNINEQQIRDMQHLLYSSNPGMFGGYDYGMMQKMGEMMKYSQPSMMNPGMMNAMNTAGAAGGMSGMSGTSGLQYEPPWQRQQQHQQQLRLQQLMQQQQNSMGAKYYAGGLGSRDPLAMALQQQRARELMLRPRARGRPPLSSTALSAASAPPAHAPAAAPAQLGDVVDLDSD